MNILFWDNFRYTENLHSFHTLFTIHDFSTFIKTKKPTLVHCY